MRTVPQSWLPMFARFWQTWDLARSYETKLPGLAKAARPGAPGFLASRYTSPPKSQRFRR